MPEDAKQIEEDAADDHDIYNVEAAEILASEAQLLPIAEATPIYEQLLSTFLAAGKYWKQYVEAYMVINNDDATKQIFSRCLLNCLQINLWRCYIRFIRKTNENKGAEGLEETKKAFDFMLSYVGTDIASGPVWMEYIAFLKSMPVSTAHEESQRMTSVRKVYQRAIVTPTHHVEQLWRDYENFENSVSRVPAKGLLSEWQPKYNSARAVYRELKKYVDIDWNMLAFPLTGSYREEQQWMAWKRYLAFEKQLTKAYFGFVEILFSNHISFILNLDTNTFMHIVGSLESGLKGLDTLISSQCAAAVDNLAAFYFNNITIGESPPSTSAVNLARHVAECPNLFPEILTSCKIAILPSTRGMCNAYMMDESIYIVLCNYSMYWMRVYVFDWKIQLYCNSFILSYKNQCNCIGQC